MPDPLPPHLRLGCPHCKQTEARAKASKVDAAALADRVTVLEKLLRQLEWISPRTFCGICNLPIESGHQEWCELAAALADVEEKKDG